GNQFLKTYRITARHDLKNLPTAFGRVTLPRRKLRRFSRRLRNLSLIPLNLETSFGFWERSLAR
ncbi:hypothetical protein DBV15_11422, partial [Temnothorax longispinosus]